MKILVTGARGFIGSALVGNPRIKDADITCVTRGPPPSDRLSKAKWFRIDQISQMSWDEIVSEKFDVICHLGWSTVPRTAENDPLADLTENVGAGLRLLEAVKNVSPKSRVIFASTGGAIYGRVGSYSVKESHPTNPISAYGIAKLSFEQYMSLYRSQYGIDCVSARISNAYGPGQEGHRSFGAISTFAKNAIEGRNISIFGSGEIVRDYIFVSDVCTALYRLAVAPTVPSVVNVASGVGTSLSEIIDIIGQSLQRKIDVEIIGGRSFDIPSIVRDNSRLKALVGWEPEISVSAGISKVLLSKTNRNSTL